MTLEEAFKFYTGEIGVSIEEFYESTPHELELKAQGILESRKQDLNLKCHAISVGVVNAMSKKKVKLFSETHESGIITKQEKDNDMKYLLDVFTD